MCLGVPMRVIHREGTDAIAELDGVQRPASLLLLAEEVAIGDYLIVHAGFAIARLDPDEAAKTLALLRKLSGEETTGPG